MSLGTDSCRRTLIHMPLFGMVTTRHSGQYTEHALASFFRHTPFVPAQDSFLLIDNDSTYTVDANRYPQIEVVRNLAPKGFAENANIAVERALQDKRDLLFLNNDLIFTPGWLEPLLTTPHAISSPLSNRELQYKTELLDLTVSMQLADYLGKEETFDLIVASHRASHQGILNVLAVPFFCIRLPLIALKSVGHFDVTFGKGGAEDYDYCLRAHLAGISVHYVLSSYVLHFGGKSSWSGAETRDEQSAREKHFFDRFDQKWGRALKAILLREEVVGTLTEQQHREVQGGAYSKVITELAPTPLPAVRIDVT